MGYGGDDGDPRKRPERRRGGRGGRAGAELSRRRLESTRWVSGPQTLGGPRPPKRGGGERAEFPKRRTILEINFGSSDEKALEGRGGRPETGRAGERLMRWSR